jgi:hypothetical protein|nr:uncharacterized protein LOC127339963 [Lolium perenne]
MHLCQVTNAKAHTTVSLTASSLSQVRYLRPQLLAQKSTIFYTESREKKGEVITGMNCIKILLLVSLIPLALRGASLLGDAVVPSPSPDPASGTSVLAPLVQVEKWRHQRRRIVDQRGRATAAFAPRRFRGTGSFFRDDKRFAPTGSNPLHNL